jgi:hypothetical protein
MAPPANGLVPMMQAGGRIAASSGPPGWLIFGGLVIVVGVGCLVYHVSSPLLNTAFQGKCSLTVLCKQVMSKDKGNPPPKQQRKPRSRPQQSPPVSSYSPDHKKDAPPTSPSDSDATTLVEEEPVLAPVKASSVDYYLPEGSTIRLRGKTASTHDLGSGMKPSNSQTFRNIEEGSNFGMKPTRGRLGHVATAVSSETSNVTSRVAQDTTPDPISHTEMAPRPSTFDTTQLDARLSGLSPSPSRTIRSKHGPLGINTACSFYVLQRSYLHSLKSTQDSRTQPEDPLSPQSPGSKVHSPDRPTQQYGSLHALW